MGNNKNYSKNQNGFQKHQNGGSRQNSGNSAHSNYSRQNNNSPHRNTNSPRNNMNNKNNARFRHENNNRDQSVQPGVLGRYQGPIPNNRMNVNGGHVTHNPPHLDDGSEITVSMAEQITGMTMEGQVNSLNENGVNFGIYGYNQLYPTYPYGYDANYYYHQMANASVNSYQQQGSQYQQVLPQNVKFSPGLWVPQEHKTKEANSTVSNPNSEEP